MRSQVLVAGIGGQGVLFATNLLGEAAMTMGVGMIGSETHGMSQRGGSVTAHVKLGEFHGPMIRMGDADVVLGFERNELLRNLPYLAPSGLCCGAVSATAPVPHEILTNLEALGIETIILDALKLAMEVGNPRLTNVVLIGAALRSKRFPFSYQLIEEVLTRIAPRKYTEANLRALEQGYRSS